MTNPGTGAPSHRGVRPLTLTYKGESITIDMPGWYGEEPDAGLFDPEDMKVSDRALNRLKARQAKTLTRHHEPVPQNS